MTTKIKVLRPTRMLANEYKKEIKGQGYGVSVVTKENDDFVFHYWELSTRKKPVTFFFEEKT